MVLGVRGKLFSVSLGLVLSVGLASGLYLLGELRSLLETRIENELKRHARTMQAVMESSPSTQAISQLDPQCDRFGKTTGARLTVIAPDGALRCDSELTQEQVADAENHANRPEIAAALATGQGQSQRWSTTLQTDMLYVAVPFQHDDERGVVRLAKPLRSVDKALARLRLLLLIAGLLGLVVAIAMSGLASHLMSRTIRSLVVHARRIADGDWNRLDVSRDDELGGLAGSLNRVSSELQTTVSELAAERARFRDVLEGFGDAVVAIDAHHNVTLMNAAAMSLLQVEARSHGQPLLEVLRAPALQDLLRTSDKQGSTEFELPGSTTVVLARITSLEHGAGSVLMLQDVTEIRRLETVRSDFVANVSHELRTPVSVILANTETLLDGAMHDPIHGVRLLEAAHRSAERLSNITSDLLDLSRIEAGRYRLESARTPVKVVIAAAVEGVAAAAGARHTSIDVDVPETFVVDADAKALEQILINYLENAVKYTPDGGRIVVAATKVADRVRIEVRDNGPGIESKHRARVFERFYRADPGRSRDMGGTGLGLSIVKRLAEAMEGEVGMTPNLPHGSVFWVTLPASLP